MSSATNTTSLSVRTLRWVLLASVLASLLVTSIGALVDQRQLLDRSHQEVLQQVNSRLDAIAAASWNYDEPVLHALLQGVIEIPTVVAIEFVGNGSPITATKKGDSAAPDRVTSIPIHSPDKTRRLGELRITESYAPLRREQLNRTAILAISVLMQTLFVAGLLFMVVDRLITRHLRRLVHELMENDTKDTSQPFFVNRRVSRKPDELDTLVAAMNRYSNELKSEISKRSIIEADLRQHRSHLEAEVATRTADLIDARNTAEAANRAKSVFLSNMSHELRTPLNAILGFAKLLERDGEIKDESRKKLATINRAGKHLLTLINDVLEISRIEADRVVISRQPFDLVDVLGSIEEMIRMRAEDKGLEFLTEHGGDLPRNVEGDGAHLKQVLINLLGNAVKYTEHGQVRFRVSHDQGEIAFEVADTGRGMSSDEQNHLFEAFYQTESAVAQAEGTGLGLAISHEYTRLMGGRLAVRSEPGKGSVFTLTLPLPETRTQVLVAATHRAIIGLEPGQEGLRILVVDDKDDNRELVRLLLESAGFEVKTANDGQQAVVAFQSWQPCFIWMDVRMPVMDGYTATRNIRALPGGQEVKIVALTASVFEEDRAAATVAGCDEMTIKPVEEDRLFEVMGKLLGLRYRYREDLPTPVIPQQGELDFSGLSAALIAELKTAANALDLHAVRDIVARIARDQSEELAGGLVCLTDQFRFDRIAELCARQEDLRA